MADFTIHTLETAPDAAKPLLEETRKSFGMLPNLYGVMAESPAHLEAYRALSAAFVKTSLTNVEQHVVWLAVNVEHTCHYCVPGHTGLAKMQGVDDETIDALRNAEPLNDPKLEALRDFTLKVVRQRGAVSDADVQTFLNAGYTQVSILDVILGVAQKVMSNYVNHLAKTPVDEPFKVFEWTPKTQAAE